MIEILKSPAEVLAGLAALGLAPVVYGSRGRTAAVHLLAAPIWLLGLLAAAFRAGSVTTAAQDFGARFVVGFAVHRSAEAAVAVAWTSLLVAVLFGVAGTRTRAPSADAWASAALLGVAGATVGGFGWLAVGAAFLAVAPRRSELAAGWAAVAALGAVAAGVGEGLSLYDPAQVAEFGWLEASLGSALAGAALAVGAVVWREGLAAVSLGAPIAALAGLAALVGWAAPARTLTALDLPELSLEPFRVPFGCLYTPRGSEVLSGAGTTPTCPATAAEAPVGRRRFPPLFGLPSSAPLSVLTVAEGGDVGLLARLPGAGFGAWRVVQLEVPIYAADAVPPTTWVDRPGATPPALGGRGDVAVPEGLVPDVASFLARCAELGGLGPGVRCGIVAR